MARTLSVGKGTATQKDVDVGEGTGTGEDLGTGEDMSPIHRQASDHH